jgi:hypothetical protein
MRKAIVALLIFAACGGNGGWDEQARADFVAGCEDGGVPRDMCVCMQEKVETRYPDMTEDDQLPTDEATEIAKECVAAGE